MKLIGFPPSPYNARVMLFARLKGIDLPRESPPGGLHSPEFKAINPIGKIPVLVLDNGDVLAESSVICEYLDETHPEPPGLPGTAEARALARLIPRVYDLYAAAHSTTLMRQVGAAEPDLKSRAAALEGLRLGLAQAERLMADAAFAAGDQPSFADCALLPPIVQIKRVHTPMFGFSDPTLGQGKLANWWKQVNEHPVFSAFAADYDKAVQSLVEKRLSTG